MASRRVAKTAVDWAAFVDRVPALQKDAFRAFKARSDMFISRVHAKPENLPTIDWAFYKSRLTNPALVDQFQKAYAAVSVPYPTDKGNLKATVDAEEQEANVQTKKYIAECQSLVKEAQSLLAKIDSLPPLEEMTHEMYVDYFPDQARTIGQNSFWPHNKSSQPGTPDEIK